MAKTILGTKTTKLGTFKRIECNRCRGTGNWDPNSYRVCYKCGGKGEYLEGNAETERNAKLAHIEEVKTEIAQGNAWLLTARFGKKQLQERINASVANLARLEAEFAAMNAKK